MTNHRRSHGGENNWSDASRAKREELQAAIPADDVQAFYDAQEQSYEAQRAQNDLRNRVEARLDAARKAIEAEFEQEREVINAQRGEADQAMANLIVEGAEALLGAKHQVRVEKDHVIREPSRHFLSKPGQMSDSHKGRCAVCSCGVFWSLVGLSNEEAPGLRRRHIQEAYRAAMSDRVYKVRNAKDRTVEA